MREQLQAPGPQPRRMWAPLVVLIVSLATTAAITFHVASTARAKDRERFHNAVQSTEDAIQSRLAAHVALLRGTAAHLTLGPSDAEKFAAYIERLAMQKDYPGVQGIGYTVKVPPGFETKLTEGVRGQYFPEFKIWPDFPREERHAIVWLEPMDRRNRAAIGYDMSTEPRRKAAMDHACDSGVPTASGKVMLVQETDTLAQAGFLIYVPVYVGWPTPPTMQERRERLLGFVFSPFRADDLIAGVLQGHSPPTVAFEIYDGTVKAENLLHRSADFAASLAGSEFETQNDLEVAGRSWTLRYVPNASFLPGSGREFTTLVLLAGILVSLGFFGISLMQARARRAAEGLSRRLMRSEAALASYQQHLEELVREQTTELETSHERLRRSERLASLGTLSTGICHEINNPLNAILLSAEYAQAVKDEAAPGEEIARALDDIVAQSKRCGRIVRNIMRFARKEESDRPLQDLNEVVRRAADLTRSYVGRARLELRLDLDAALPPVPVDAGEIEQVIVNLVQNAAEAAEGNVQVTLATRRHNGEVVVCVTDDGPGIAAEHIPHIFDPFFSTRREKGGTGLGLSMVHGIITEHCGWIDVESEKGCGATFTIHLPLRNTPQEPASNG